MGKQMSEWARSQWVSKKVEQDMRDEQDLEYEREIGGDLEE